MKKLISIAIFFMFSSLLFAETRAAVAPVQAGFGINMATDDYNFNNNATHIGYDNGISKPSSAPGNYGDDAMIGIGGVWNIDKDASGPNSPITISVSCPNGFYFVSNSNPDAKRPFKVLVVPKTSTSHYENNSGSINVKESSGLILGDNPDVLMDSISFPNSGYDWGDDPVWEKNPSNGISILRSQDYRYIWCDIVLVLPYVSHTSTGTLYTGDGKAYHLVEADDYSAVVTINIEWNGTTDSIVIPMSGYYSRNPIDISSTANLVVNRLPRAMNLDIAKEPKSYERVAEVYFMSNSANNQKIFLSASNDPMQQSERGFELVHSSVNYATPHTERNSIGYSAMLTSDTASMTFEGSDGIIGNEVPGISIIPETSSATGSDRTWSEFNGYISVKIDDPPAMTADRAYDGMLQGQYTSNIYVHVVDTGATS